MPVRPGSSRLRRRRGLGALALLLLSGTSALAEMRGLVVGIDRYRTVPSLRGAVSDAGDIAGVLKGRGAEDVTVLANEAASSKSIAAAIDALTRRTRADDTVVLSFAGVGATLDARSGGGITLLLPGYAPGSAQPEILPWSSVLEAAARLEKAGAQVVIINDFASGIEQVRETDLRAAGGALRGTQARIAAPAATGNPPPTLQRTAILSAASAGHSAAEVTIADKGPRGALSYAVARGLEGSADANHDGIVTGAELADYVRLVGYQIADQRQQPEVVTGAGLSRGISVQPVGSSRPPVTSTPPTTPPPPAAQLQPVQAPQSPLPPPAQAQPRIDGAKVRVAALAGQGTRIQRFVLPVAFEVVDPKDRPDLVWDPGTKDVVSGGDVIARNVEVNDVPGVIERTSVVRSLRTVVAKSPQAIRLLPGDGLHRKGNRVEIEVKALRGRSLILFNIAGNGAVQLLFPAGNDRNQFEQDDFRLPLSVSEPFGADQVVAITSAQRLNDVERALRDLERSAFRKMPTRVLELLDRLPAGTAVGTVGLFTAP